MPDQEDRIMDEAINWTVRLRDGSSGDWQKFTAWLEADPAHLVAFEEAAEFDDRLGQVCVRGRSPSLEDRRPRSRRRWVVGGAAAAALAASVFSWWAVQGSRELYPVETAAGQRLELTLAGGSTIHVNGETKLLLDREDARFAELVHGEALFTVAHDPSTAFQVNAGSAYVRNLGTVFDVRRDGNEVAVAVAKGAVLFSAAGRDVRLAQGDTATIRDDGIEAGRTDPAAIGGWRKGQLSYSSARLSEVARDVARVSGVEVQVAPGLAGRRFTGVIIVDGDREALKRRLGAVLDVDVQLAGTTWVLAPVER